MMDDCQDFGPKLALHVTSVTRYTLQALQNSVQISLYTFTHLHIFTSFRYTLQVLHVTRYRRYRVTGVTEFSTNLSLHIFTSPHFHIGISRTVRRGGFVFITTLVFSHAHICHHIKRDKLFYVSATFSHFQIFTFSHFQINTSIFQSHPLQTEYPSSDQQVHHRP